MATAACSHPTSLIFRWPLLVDNSEIVLHIQTNPEGYCIPVFIDDLPGDGYGCGYDNKWRGGEGSGDGDFGHHGDGAGEGDLICLA